MNILIIDIGTSSMRGIIFSDEGCKKNLVQKKYHPFYKGCGIVEQNVSDFENAMLNIVKESQRYADISESNIDAIAITAQRSSIIPVDIDGNPICPAIMWQDTRNSLLIEELEKENKTIFKYSGTHVNTLYSGGKMAWFRKYRPLEYQKLYKFVNIPEYLIHLMTGEYASDYTYASRSNLLNIRTRQFDPNLLEIFNVDEQKLCRLVSPGEIIGSINKKFSNLSGIKDGTPVITSGGDQQCAAIGQGTLRKGDTSIVLGTGAYIVTDCNQIPKGLENDVVLNCSSLRNHYILEANLLTCCAAFDWFVKNFYYGSETDYNLLNSDLERVYPEKEECIVLPFFQGRSTPDWNYNAKALFTNLSLHSTRAGMLKALVEGICIEIAENIEHIEKYVDIKQISISGGLTNSRVINQIQADIYGRPILKRDDSESTAYGALIVALVGLGVFSNEWDAFQKICGNQEPTVFTPSEVKKQEYEFKKNATKEIYRKLF